MVNMANHLLKSACVLFIVLSAVQCDTPANCSYEEVVGDWTFSLSQPKVQRGRSALLKSNFLPPVYGVSLLRLNTAIDQFGNVGTWTLIYNQGFEAIIAGRAYFGFFSYDQNGTQVTSYCYLTNATMSYNVLNGDRLTWSGKKVNSHNKKVHSLPEPNQLEALLYQQNSKFIREINQAQNTWKATHYAEFESKTMKDLVRMAGGKNSVIYNRPKPAPASPELLKLADSLPANFDWRNRSGINYVSQVKNQGSCGSCYSFSATGMVESRLRIMTNNTVQDLLSEQDVIECSKYSQGCDGGFPYLIGGKYAQNMGLLLDKCKPYTGKDGDCSVPECKARYHVSSYHYIGGYYGACNEKLMQLALVDNGPLSVSFEVYDDFTHYKSGIYVHTGIKSSFNPFELTNHAVLLVGYGVDATTGTKYWIVKNSWGSSWGENGYFRILRGVDECAIESIAVESFPIPI